MRFRFIAEIIKEIFSSRREGDKPRADMYLPDWLLVISIIFIVTGAALTVVAILGGEYLLIVMAAFFLVAGIGGILCWKNQKINILSDTEFEYTTFLGNKRIYRFNEIRAYRQNRDSITLFVRDEKVHIESCALMTERLVEKLNSAVD